MRKPTSKIWICFAMAAGLIVFTSGAWAANDTARFYGTWEANVPFNGQMITVESVHDASGYKNHVPSPGGDVPAGDGTFSAVNGRWTSNAAKPNDSGTYHFIGDNTVVCTNAAGQIVTWKRVKTSQPDATAPASQPEPAGRPGTQPVSPGGVPSRSAGAAPPAEAPDPSLSPGVNRAIAAFDKKDYNTAWREFMAAAQQGDAEAQAGVGAMLFRHLNPPGSGYYAQAEKWFTLSANQGNIKGMDYLAQFYYQDGVNIAGGINPGINNAPIPPQLQAQAEKSFAKARQWFGRSAVKGDGYAMGNLAIMLDAGVGGPRDPARAAQLRAQVAGHSDANFPKRATSDPGNPAIAAAWQSGHYADALKNAQERAAKGDANAEALLGRAYYEGVDVARNYAIALKWLKAAAAQKNADAIFFLGLMYEHGRGVPQDLDRSIKLFDQAAAMGQHYADMEAQGMRLQGESNRVAALAHRNSSSEDVACGVAGGVSSPGGCIRGGETIDPYNSTVNESN